MHSEQNGPKYRERWKKVQEEQSSFLLSGHTFETVVVDWERVMIN